MIDIFAWIVLLILAASGIAIFFVRGPPESCALALGRADTGSSRVKSQRRGFRLSVIALPVGAPLKS